MERYLMVGASPIGHMMVCTECWALISELHTQGHDDHHARMAAELRGLRAALGLAP